MHFRITPVFRCTDAPGNTDLHSLEAHVVYSAGAGVCPLLAGTMGEGIHLAHGERTRIIQTTRKALDAAGFLDTPIIVGAGGGSTRETVALCEEVAAAGADAAIVITPGYFTGVLANHRRALKEYYVEVARKSPVPVLIYNCACLLPLPVESFRRSMYCLCIQILGPVEESTSTRI